MKMNKEITILEKWKKDLPVPVYQPRWDSFKAGLEKIAKENLGYDAKDLDWDPHSQTFYFLMSKSTAIGDFRGTFEITITLDVMSQSIEKGLAQALEEMKRFTEACFIGMRTLEKKEEAADRGHLPVSIHKETTSADDRADYCQCGDCGECRARKGINP